MSVLNPAITEKIDLPNGTPQVFTTLTLLAANLHSILRIAVALSALFDSFPLVEIHLK